MLYTLIPTVNKVFYAAVPNVNRLESNSYSLKSRYRSEILVGAEKNCVGVCVAGVD